ncbi:hypothetical protein ACQ4PT_011368 [Festuca glaucescens]
MNTALRTRWLWFNKIDAQKPWAGLDVNVGKDCVALFNASVHIELGNGETTLFWDDPWIGGLAAQAIAPDLLPLVRPAVRRRRSVRDGLLGNSWASDISGALTVPAVVQYLRLWAAVAAVPFQEHGEDNADKVTWKWRGDGQFSSKSAYRLLFQGTVGLPGAHLVWHSFAPLKFKMHAWLALRRRCWTADRRLRRGLPSHSLCPLCGVADETLDHLSLQCIFAHERAAPAVPARTILTITYENGFPEFSDGSHHNDVAADDAEDETDPDSDFQPMAREEDLTDQQFDELCQQYAPTILCRRSERAAPAGPARTILTITYENGFPEFSDGSHHNDIVVDDAEEETDSDSGTDTAAEEADAETDEDDSDDETTQAEETDTGSDAPTETDTDTESQGE